MSAVSTVCPPSRGRQGSTAGSWPPSGRSSDLCDDDNSAPARRAGTGPARDRRHDCSKSVRSHVVDGAPRFSLIAGSDICAGLLLPISDRPKQKRDARRDHACGVCAWVVGAVMSAPSRWLLFLTAAEVSPYRATARASVRLSLPLSESHSSSRSMARRRCGIDAPRSWRIAGADGVPRSHRLP